MAAKPKKKRAQQPKLIRIVNILIGRANRREVLTFLLFVLLSFVFWIVHTSREENVSEYSVNLLIEDQPQDMVFTTHVPSQLRVAIEDNNLNLLRYAYDDRLRTLTVDFERYADATGNFRISAAELQSLLRTDLNNTTRITSISPSLIDARFAQTEGRKFPVRVHGYYLPADNFRVHQLSVKPDSVIINAPSAVLDTMQYAYTMQTMHTELRDSLREELPLSLPLGVKATPSKVFVTAPVSQFVERVFDDLPIQAIHLPQGHSLALFPYSARVTCLVDFDAYAKLCPEDFVLTVDYDSILSPTQHFLSVKVGYLGDESEVTNIQVHPNRAEFIIEKE